ncbi:hypothetical protein EDB86DRAFT_2829395 [Lactarius hatsudake]|nr:hypothetical protein EDB86DRAFT_2829395 [Lactarius hatsudake]
MHSVGVGGGWGLACRVAGRQGLMRRGGVLVESAGGRVLRAVLGWRGGQWQLGLMCHIEAVWQVGGVLACHVGSARWVGGGGAGWRWFAFSRVLRAVLGQRGGLAMAGCWGRMEVARVHKWPATSRVLRAVLGWRGGLAVVACWGRDEWKQLACTSVTTTSAKRHKIRPAYFIA